MVNTDNKIKLIKFSWKINLILFVFYITLCYILYIVVWAVENKEKSIIWEYAWTPHMNPKINGWKPRNSCCNI